MSRRTKRTLGILALLLIVALGVFLTVNFRRKRAEAGGLASGPRLDVLTVTERIAPTPLDAIDVSDPPSTQPSPPAIHMVVPRQFVSIVDPTGSAGLADISVELLPTDAGLVAMPGGVLGAEVDVDTPLKSLKVMGFKVKHVEQRNVASGEKREYDGYFDISVETPPKHFTLTYLLRLSVHPGTGGPRSFVPGTADITWQLREDARK